MASSGKVLTKKAGPCGGGGGVAKDMDTTGITRVVKIGVRSGWTVDSITVTFQRNGKEESTDLWGGPGGVLTEITLQPSEYITSVKGHIGNFEGVFILRSLKIETNLKTYGPYGREEGNPFELPAFGGEIIGFHGRSGKYLDAIGVYVKARDTTSGGTNGSGTPGSWTQSDTNFWGRDTTSGGTNGSGTPGSWTQSDTNFWGRDTTSGGTNGSGTPGSWTQSDTNFWGRDTTSGGTNGSGTLGSWTQSDTNFWGRDTTSGGTNGSGTPGSWTQSDTNFWGRDPTSGGTNGSGTPGSWTQSDTNFWGRDTTSGGTNGSGTPGSWTQSETNFWGRPVSGA